MYGNQFEEPVPLIETDESDYQIGGLKMAFPRHQIIQPTTTAPRFTAYLSCSFGQISRPFITRKRFCRCFVAARIKSVTFPCNDTDASAPTLHSRIHSSNITGVWAIISELDDRYRPPPRPLKILRFSQRASNNTRQ